LLICNRRFHRVLVETLSNFSQQPLVTASEFQLEPIDNERLASLCGQFDAHIRQIERRVGVEINNRGGSFRIIGSPESVETAARVLKELYQMAEEENLSPARVHLFMQQAGLEEGGQGRQAGEDVVVRTRRATVRPRGPNQRIYLENIRTFDVNFGIGPAGTGKTYLAVAAAVEALERESVRRLILVRPAVEAGERLGFLPGDMVQKVDPYLRPLYDALYEMLGFERVAKFIERNIIEVAPLAFMRGRTLNESFIILDEAQNTTTEQMKMFLTRIGFGSTAVINGDITQIDLPKGRQSGLRQVIEVLRGYDGISFTFFKSKDVVRHPLVGRILDAYEHHERSDNGSDAAN
jgi:phosphate starvation-inducible PhoH-like protein